MDDKEFKFLANKNCRVCLQTYSEMCQIFGEGNGLEKILRECGRVEVEENDGLPVVMCEYCVQEMTQAHHFLTKCQDADRRLRLALITHGEKEETKEVVLGIQMEDADIKTEVGIFDPEDINETIDHCSDEANYCAQSDSPYTNKFVEVSKECTSGKKSKKRGKSFPKKCPLCGLVVSCEAVLIVHTRTHTNERPFQCNECVLSFKAKSALENHQRRCHLKDYPKTHQCEECKKYFFCGTELRVHMRSHTGDTPYKCKHCDKAYTQSASLKRHVRSRHTGERPHQCSKCPKNFVTLTELQKHEAIHSDERKFVCHICNFAFKCKSSLRIHLPTHSKTKRFVCDHCGASFHTKTNLNVHQNRKHSELAGQCVTCNKVFSNLNDHMRIHTGETPFHCEVCGKRFSLKSSFFIHMQVHNSDKHPCLYQGCNKTFPKINYLEYHVLKHHKKFTPYVCKYCDKGYFRLADIKNHTKVNHLGKDMTYLKKIKIPSSFFTDVHT